MKSVRSSQRVALLGALLVGCSESPGPSGGAAPFALDAGPTVAQGYAAVASRQCGRCHQSPDPRDGLLSGQTSPLEGTGSYSANLTPDPDTGMDAWDADSIANAVLLGIDDQGARLCPPMPSFAEAGMGYDEALGIAVYLQSLTPVRHVVPASLCPSDKVAKDAGP